MGKCTFCEKELKEDFNFCPRCGEAISNSAKKLETTKTLNAQLLILATLVKELNDVESLKIVDKYIKNLSQNR